jgi:NhaA family Na+:H+ antiporter
MANRYCFALSFVSLGNRVPLSLNILTALAVIDDLGCNFSYCHFYTKTIFWLNLGIAMGIMFFFYIESHESIHIVHLLNWRLYVVFYA